MRRVRANYSKGTVTGVHRIVTLEVIAAEWEPDLQLLAAVSSDEEKNAIAQLQDSGLSNLGWIESASLEVGDVVVSRPDTAECVVLYREVDVHHALQITNQCNSYCLMCSQPPTKQDDPWVVNQTLEVIRHIRTSPDAIGLSGGEPLLHGPGLRRVIEKIARLHPTTHIEVLTNGRLFAQKSIIKTVLAGLNCDVSWLIPLYGHADIVHDFVVQSPGAFEETIAGLLTLQENHQAVQLRVVLIEPVLRILPELCAFVGRNLPFVREVALMACEPIGFALANRELCEVELVDWAEVLKKSANVLKRYRVPFVFMNTPLCALPQDLWKNAKRSISDWKNVYVSECDDCSVKIQCAGLFAWHEDGWKPTRIQALRGIIHE